jgi:hypothetical protein
VTDPSHPLFLEYERFAHAHTVSTLPLSRQEATDAITVAIWFSNDYLSEVEVGQVGGADAMLEANGGISIIPRVL